MTPAKLAARCKAVGAILPPLRKEYPGAKCTLDYRTPLQLLVATIMSAQCTDARVNLVTPALFKKYRNAAAYAAADPRELERDLQSTGFYRTKAKNIQAMARSLIEQHGGKVPKTMQELTALAGVGRKTANVVLGNAFGSNVGVVVDTHVTRLAGRLGLTDHASDAKKIELDLMEIVPQKDWTIFSHLLIHHGRAVCRARDPQCGACVLLKHCPTGQKLIKKKPV